ncbi:MAG: hypothetical protein RLZZ399_1427 [Verrucomicrobiota bacterium]|jgi:hypothetical protein
MHRSIFSVTFSFLLIPSVFLLTFSILRAGEAPPAQNPDSHDFRSGEEIAASIAGLRAVLSARNISSHQKTDLLALCNQTGWRAANRSAIAVLFEMLGEAWESGSFHESLLVFQPRLGEGAASDLRQNRSTRDLRKDVRRFLSLQTDPQWREHIVFFRNEYKKETLSHKAAYAFWKERLKREQDNPAIEALWRAGILQTWLPPSFVMVNTEKLESLFLSTQAFDYRDPSERQELLELEQHYQALLDYVSPAFDSLLQSIHSARAIFTTKVAQHYLATKQLMAPDDRNLFENYLGRICKSMAYGDWNSKSGEGSRK